MRSLAFYFPVFVLLATGVATCQKMEDNPFSHVQSTNSEAPAVRSTISSPVSPVPPLRCQVGKQHVKEISTPNNFDSAVLNRIAAQVVGRAFEDDPEDHNGLALYLEVLATPSQTHVGILYHGVRGFLKTREVMPPSTWEAQIAGEGPLPEECLSGLADEQCVSGQLQQYVQPDIELVVRRLRWLCRLDVEPPEFVRAALLESEDWIRIAAARAVGERKLITLRLDLEELLTVAGPSVFPPAIGALGRLGDEGSIPALMKVSRGSDEHIIKAVAVALSDIGTPLARRYLAEWRDNHHLNSIRDLARELLDQE